MMSMPLPKVGIMLINEYMYWREYLHCLGNINAYDYNPEGKGKYHIAVVLTVTHSMIQRHKIVCKIGHVYISLNNSKLYRHLHSLSDVLLFILLLFMILHVWIGNINKFGELSGCIHLYVDQDK